MTLTWLRRPGRREGATAAAPADPAVPTAPTVPTAPAPDPTASCQPIATLQWRERASVAGRVRSLRVQPWADVPTLECKVVDPTGGITVVFLGRRSVAGLRLGSRVRVEGMVGDHHGRLAILNPDYRLLAE